MTHTLDEVRQIAADLIDRYSPDFTYQKDGDHCVYYRESGAPSCFVGHVIDLWGEPFVIETAKWADAIQRKDQGGKSAAQVLGRGGCDIEPIAVRYLDAFQDWQDSGFTWGEAMLHAEHEVGLHAQHTVGCRDCEAV